MPPRIAIPVPTGTDHDYNARNWPAFADAVTASGGEPVRIPLHLSPREIAELAGTCQAILLPGSPADVNPEKYGQPRGPATASPDLPRENVDELLLQDAHNLYKPILGVCYGCQILNVWRSGTLLQDLTVLPVNHAAGPSVASAHSAVLAPGSLLASILGSAITPHPVGSGETGSPTRLLVNSSHHQAIGILGDGLRASARSPEDGVVEAIEGGQHTSPRLSTIPGLSSAHGHPKTADEERATDNEEQRSNPETPTHFVLGVQWHPERNFATDAASQALFRRLVDEAAAWKPRAVLTSVA